MKMMKTLVSSFLLAAVSLGIAGTSFAQAPYSACLGNNSKPCVDARNAFAEHHGGVYPEQYYNSWYNGNRGRWYQENNAWRWEGVNGDRYWNDGPNGWQWHRWKEHEEREEHEEHEHHHHHHDHD